MRDPRDATASGRNRQRTQALRESGADAPGELHVIELDVRDDESARRAVNACDPAPRSGEAGAFNAATAIEVRG